MTLHHPMLWIALTTFALKASAATHPAAGLGSSDPRRGVADIRANFAALPLAFERNVGQAHSSIDFVARGPGYSAFLTASEVILLLERAEGARGRNAVGVSPAPTSLRMQFVGARKANPAGDDALPFQTNYFRGPQPADQIVGVKNFARVRYASVYPGVDLVYYGQGGRLEYDLVIQPRADARQIRLAFAGAENTSLAPNGELVLNTRFGEVRFPRPVAYQGQGADRKSVKVAYRLADDGGVRFAVGEYDSTAPLVIDPILDYSSFFWGLAVGIAVDAQGNIYVGGYTTTGDLPAGGGYQTKLAGSQDAYVVKLDPTGTKVVYATYLGGRRATSYVTAVGVDGSGNAYITGGTSASSFPVTTSAYEKTYMANASFVTKFNATGNALLYSTFVNGARISAMSVDNAGNAFLAGYTNGGTFATTPGAYLNTGGGGVIAKLAPSGQSMVYASLLQGVPNAVAIDTAGNAYVTGTNSGNGIPAVNAFQPARRGGNDAFVAKLNAAGSALLYSSYLGGSNDDFGNAIAVDDAGEAFVAGRTHSDDFPVSFAAFQARKGYPDPAVSNAFIAKVSAAGDTLQYASYLGGAWCLTSGVYSCIDFTSDGIDGATAVAVDGAGYAYLGGYATSIAFPLSDPVQGTGASGSDGWRQPFVAKVTPGGDRLVYSVVLGARGNDEEVTALALGPAGAIHAVGLNGAAGGVYPTTAGAPLTQAGPSFIFRLNSGAHPTTLRSSRNPAGPGDTVILTADVLSPKPGGSVSFFDGAASLGAAPVLGGQAVLPVQLASGAHHITAVNSGDSKVSPPLYQVITGP